MKEVKLYTWSYCPYCKRAIALLDKKKIDYVEIGIDGDSQKFNELSLKTGHKSVPFVFINNEFIGGFAELKALNNSSALDKILGK
ncbi:glutaredoxin domain-containing protein [Alkalibacter mobilis]|uniref:glutaredoxin domain-containing protein n=1 Tax=Alkalibacter mobilis TaxID=2787712 RepID=UPI00189E4098|nr:glutaredoxin domain-containing protein [Alkalibacter mobilis]MBF7096397.1 glutathione S-transferase N-terminal domain-containing protein [Alkalibacter mobilis]